MIYQHTALTGQARDLHPCLFRSGSATRWSIQTWHIWSGCGIHCAHQFSVKSIKSQFLFHTLLRVFLLCLSLFVIFWSGGKTDMLIGLIIFFSIWWIALEKRSNKDREGKWTHANKELELLDANQLITGKFAVYMHNSITLNCIFSIHYFKHIKVSALALLKMVMHARSGGNLEVMGLMVGKIDGKYRYFGLHLV